MPPIDPRRERFAHEYVKTGIARAAYQAAGYTATALNSIDATASEILSHPKVATRIVEIRQEMAQETRVTVAGLVAEIVKDRTQAREIGQPATALAASMAIAKLLGLVVERKEVGAPGEFAALDDELAVIALIRQQLGTDAADMITGLLGKPADVSSDDSSNSGQ